MFTHRDTTKQIVTWIFRAMLALAVIGWWGKLSADVMQGSIYKMESDSLNSGGGDSSSATYNLDDTVGEIGTGESESETYSLNAGFRQKDYYVMVGPAADVVMSPAIGGIIGGSSDGSTSLQVTTDDPAGYTMTIQAEQSPALAAVNDSIADYSPAGANPDFNFAVADSESCFAFSPEGPDIVSRFQDNGAACGLGEEDTPDKCWDGLSTSPQVVAKSASYNAPLRTQTDLKFKVGVGSNRLQEEGEYTATTTVTIILN